MTAAQTPLWKYALDHAEQADPNGVYAALVADGAEKAYRALLDKWVRMRDSGKRDLVAGLALMLAHSFDDHRAVEYIAQNWSAPFPDEFAWRCYLQPASEPVRRAFSPKVIEELRTWLVAHDADSLPLDLARSARTLRADDRGAVYLQLRRDLTEAAPQPNDPAVERVTDELLVAAASATPDRPDVRNTVLSYWGLEQPLDAVPTGEPQPGEQPASWTATCELIHRTRDAAFADRVIEVAHGHREGWTSSSMAAEQYLRALEATVGNTAETHLLEIARAEVPASGLAVQLLAARRRRLAGVRPPLLKRVELVLDGMHVSGLLARYEGTGPGRQARAALAKVVDEADDTMTIAHRIAESLDIPNDDTLALEWASFASWALENELPEVDPVPAPQPPARRSRGLLGRLFGN